MRLALFDLDHTLLPIDSDHAWGEYTVARGLRDPVEFKARNDAFYKNDKVGKLNPVEYRKRYLRFIYLSILIERLHFLAE
jgi:phosphoserine phosphatase